MRFIIISVFDGALKFGKNPADASDSARAAYGNESNIDDLKNNDLLKNIEHLEINHAIIFTKYFSHIP